jgi:hypothetical protein
LVRSILLPLVLLGIGGVIKNRGNMSKVTPGTRDWKNDLQPFFTLMLTASSSGAW